MAPKLGRPWICTAPHSPQDPTRTGPGPTSVANATDLALNNRWLVIHYFEPPSALKDTDLLAKLKAPGDVSQSELVRAAGSAYSVHDGTKRLSLTAFPIGKAFSKRGSAEDLSASLCDSGKAQSGHGWRYESQRQLADRQGLIEALGRERNAFKPWPSLPVLAHGPQEDLLRIARRIGIVETGTGEAGLDQLSWASFQSVSHGERAGLSRPFPARSEDCGWEPADQPRRAWQWVLPS